MSLIHKQALFYYSNAQTCFVKTKHDCKNEKGKLHRSVDEQIKWWQRNVSMEYVSVSSCIGLTMYRARKAI